MNAIRIAAKYGLSYSDVCKVLKELRNTRGKNYDFDMQAARMRLIGYYQKKLEKAMECEAEIAGALRRLEADE